MAADSLIIPEAPAIPGLVFRYFSGEADLPGIAAVINASNAADLNRERLTAEKLAHTFAHPVHWDPRQDCLLVEIDGALVGYAYTEWREEDTGDCLHLIRLHLVPEWRGRGLELAMHCHMERRARDVAAGVGTPGVRHVFAGLVPETWGARTAMLIARGYPATRHFFDMERSLDGELPAAPLPAGIEIRPVLPEHSRPIWDANVEAFRDHWSNMPPDEEDYQAWLESPERDPSLWVIAWDGDQVAGGALNMLYDDGESERGAVGWVDDLFVRRPWRKQGLGRALLVGSLRVFKARGLAMAGLNVDAENLTGALRLYERVGFRVYRHMVAYDKAM